MRKTEIHNLKFKHCKQADREHEQSKRQYAHVGHYLNTICVAHTFCKLPIKYQFGIFYHEIGHILLSSVIHTEQDANKIIKQEFGITIKHANSKYGRHLEYVNVE